MTTEPLRKKYYELQHGDKAWHDEVLTFIKMDGMYAIWEDASGLVKMGHAYEYELDFKKKLWMPVEEIF